MTTPSLADIAKGTVKAKPAPTPAPIPAVVATVIETEVVTDVFSGSSAVAVVSGAASAALAVIDNADASDSYANFHRITVSGGAQGGQFVADDGVPDDILMKLPQGRSPAMGIFIGFRAELAAWGTGYDDRDPAAEPRPSWSCAIPSNDGPNSVVLEEAAKQYQFTPKASKAKFDFANSQVGHIRPVLTAMIWSPALGDLLIVQSCAGYEPWLESLRSLGKLVDPATGGIPRIPITVRARSEQRESKKSGFSWLVHTLTFDVAATESGGAMLTAFNAWREGVSTERKAQVAEWLSAADRPMTDDIVAALRKAKTL